MNIEDLIILLSIKGRLNPFDEKLVRSFHDQISRGTSFTVRQSTVAVKILRQHSTELTLILGKNVNQYLENPVFRLGHRTISYAKQISVVEHKDYGKALKIEFPYNEEMLEKIRKEKQNLPFATWDKDVKAWILTLNERAIQLGMKFVEEDEFVPDEEFIGLMDQVRTIHDNLEKHIPMVSYSEKTPKFINVSDRVPQPNTTDVLESLFLGRKSGIHTWDESVSTHLTENMVSPSTISFLNESPGVPFSLNLDEHNFSDLENIIKCLSPALFVIPGGHEIEKTEKSIEFLKSIGISNKEISVLFRLPSETGGKFNKFVKDEGLNNPISDNTRIVFISGKVPKTVISEKIKFNCVVNFSIHSVHYTIREFVKNHHNVIHVLDSKQQRNINFASL